MKKVSVIIPNYNHAAYLKKRIDSVLNQTRTDFEVLILDDNSQDNSKDIIESYSNHPKVSCILFNETNSGSTISQWEKGLNLANGDYIWIAESDDWADNNFLELLMKEMEKDEAVALAYCQSFDVAINEVNLGSRLEWTADFENNIWENSFCLEGTDFLKYLFRKNVIPNASACICKKEVLVDALQNFKNHPPFKMAGDWFTWLIIANTENVKISFVKEHLNFFRKHEKSTRIHNTPQKKKRRVLEEAIIFNSIKYSVDQHFFVEKNEVLLNKWVGLYPINRLNKSIFDIVPILKISAPKLIARYLVNKYKATKKRCYNKWDNAIAHTFFKKTPHIVHP